MSNVRCYNFENTYTRVESHLTFNIIHLPFDMIPDQVGTINQVYSHQSQAVVDTRTYDVFGSLINQSGSSSGNMGFQSKYFDAESGLNYYYYRYYYPQVGRFINEDPIGIRQELNLYFFVGNNSINFIDPYGDKVKYPTGISKALCIAACHLSAMWCHLKANFEKNKGIKSKNHKQCLMDYMDCMDLCNPFWKTECGELPKYGESQRFGSSGASGGW